MLLTVCCVEPTNGRIRLGDYLISPHMGDGQQGAYSTKAADTDFRRKWDKEEYAERAKKKDDEERERMQENEERMKQGTVHIAHRQCAAKLTYRTRKEASQGEEKGSTKAHGTHEASGG